MPNLSRVHAISRAKNDLLERLRRAPPREWAELVARGLRNLHARAFGDPTVVLTSVVDLIEQISRLPEGRRLHAPDELVEKIAQRDYLQGSDADRLLAGLEGDVSRWVSKRRPVNGTERISRFIDSHLREPLTVASLARTFGYSRRRLSQVYKQHTGLTIRQYVVRQRIERAEMLVRQGEKIEAAMLAVGYRNKTHFYRAFERIAGCKPGKVSTERPEPAPLVGSTRDLFPMGI